MEIEGRTIILSTPEELLPLITQAVRTAEQGKTADAPDLPGKKLLAPKDVEREFGIHQKTLAYWHMEGVGPVYTNFGRRVFYERAVLEEYIASGRVQTSDTFRCWISQASISPIIESFSLSCPGNRWAYRMVMVMFL